MESTILYTVYVFVIKVVLYSLVVIDSGFVKLKAFSSKTCLGNGHVTVM